MKPLFPILLLAVSAAVLSAQQDKKTTPPPPKVPSHSPEQSALNRLKQNERVRKELNKAKDLLDRSERRNEAAEKEAERLRKEKSLPSKEEAKSMIDKIREKEDLKDLKGLEELLKSSSQEVRKSMEEELRRYREQKKAEKPDEAPAPAPEADAGPVPGSFEGLTPGEPLPLQAGPVFTPAPIRADHGYKGPSRDPKNPAKMLPPSDPRPRTYLLNGNVSFRNPTSAMDADEVEVLFKEGESPGLESGAGGNNNKSLKPASPAKQPKNPAMMDSSIERIIARGRVRIMVVDETGRVQIGRGGYAIYDSKTGAFILKDFPEMEAGGKLIKAVSKNATIRFGNLEDIDLDLLDIYTLETEKTAADLPRTPGQTIPNSGRILDKNGVPQSPP